MLKDKKAYDDVLTSAGHGLVRGDHVMVREAGYNSDAGCFYDGWFQAKVLELEVVGNDTVEYRFGWVHELYKNNPGVTFKLKKGWVNDKACKVLPSSCHYKRWHDVGCCFFVFVLIHHCRVATMTTITSTTTTVVGAAALAATIVAIDVPQLSIE